MNKDEYLMYLRRDGTRFYCKGKKLHRESGPAIVVAKDFEKYSNLADEYLYKEISCSYPELAQLSLKKNKVSTKVMSVYSDSHYFLDGIEYAKAEFNAIILTKELSAIKNTSNIKRVKV